MKDISKYFLLIAVCIPVFFYPIALELYAEGRIGGGDGSWHYLMANKILENNFVIPETVSEVYDGIPYRWSLLPGFHVFVAFISMMIPALTVLTVMKYIGVLFFLLSLYPLYRLAGNDVYAPIIFASIPMIIAVSSFSLPDIVSLFFVIFALKIFYVDNDRFRYKFIAGLVLGAGGLIDKIAWSFIPLFIVMCLYEIFRSGKSKVKIFLNYLVMLTAFVLSCGWWIIGSWMMHGNPFRQGVPLGIADVQATVVLMQYAQALTGLDLLLVLSIILIIFAPIGFFISLQEGNHRIHLSVIWIASFIFLLFLTRGRIFDARFLMYLLPPLCIVAALGFRRQRQLLNYKTSKILFSLMFVVVVLSQSCFTGVRISENLVGFQYKEFFEGSDWCRDNLSKDSFVLCPETYMFVAESGVPSTWISPYGLGELFYIMYNLTDRDAYYALQNRRITHIFVFEERIGNGFATSCYPKNFVELMSSSEYFLLVYENESVNIFELIKKNE